MKSGLVERERERERESLIRERWSYTFTRFNELKDGGGGVVRMRIEAQRERESCKFQLGVWVEGAPTGVEW